MKRKKNLCHLSLHRKQKKADVGFYVLQVLLCVLGGAFAAYVGSNHVASECAQPVAIWLQILGGTIAAIGLLWWLALFGLKRIKRIKVRMWVNRFFWGFTCTQWYIFCYLVGNRTLLGISNIKGRLRTWSLFNWALVYYWHLY